MAQVRGLSVAPAAQAGAQGQAAAAGAQGGGTGQQGSGSALAPTIDTTEDPVEGDPNAPVTIIEFSDFQCPYCETFFSQSLPQIRSQYIDTGKVKMIYKQFPQAVPAELPSEGAEGSRGIGVRVRAGKVLGDA